MAPGKGAKVHGCLFPSEFTNFIVKDFLSIENLRCDYPACTGTCGSVVHSSTLPCLLSCSRPLRLKSMHMVVTIDTILSLHNRT